MNHVKTVLVHIDAGPYGPARLRTARQVASQFGARLHALYAVTPAYAALAIDLAAGAASGTVGQAIDDDRLEAARKLKQHVAAEPGAAFEWHEARTLPYSAVTRQARYADLLVLGQYDPQEPSPGVPPDFVESVLIASGRPALVLPYVNTGKTMATRVLVAWKETAEAARAVSAALPFLQRAERAHVAHWGDEEPDDVSQPLDILAYLHAHGVRAEMHRHAAAGAEVGDLMQSLAADLSADLLVMGCYGHTRAREWVLGGASRTVLRSMTLPVLMAH